MARALVVAYLLAVGLLASLERRMRPGAFRRLAEAGCDVVHVNDRGCPGSAGQPSEEGLLLDARAAWDVARGLSDTAWIFGKSLGGGVALALAADRCDAGDAPLAVDELLTTPRGWAALDALLADAARPAR